ncbi:MAG TPA: cation-translocating P-type ATPase, partial [Psychromonas sp.]
FVVAAKGAPESIADLCHFDASQLQALSVQVSAMAGEGLRVLAMAKASCTGKPWPLIQHDFEFVFLGLIGLADPIRANVPEAIKECRNAGVRVVMITGDHAQTASAIARQAGLGSACKIMTGEELEKLSDSALQMRIKTTSIFARIVPEQKLRLVNAFKANGEVVAMTGDGVNDAPALKAAHIGIAMGGRGTDVAREAASLVLLDDDFSSIVHAIRLGRRIYDNLIKAMSYILAAHLPIAGLTIIPLMLGWPLILSPMHIVFLEMVINPACSIVFEAESEEDNVMNRPPRAPEQPLFGGRRLMLSILQGLSVLLIVLLLYGIALHRGQGEAESRTLAFTALVISNLSLILTNRSWSSGILSLFSQPNRALWWVLGGTILFLSLILYVPALMTLFHFVTLHPNDLLLCFTAGIAGVVGFEIMKIWNGKKAGSTRK